MTITAAGGIAVIVAFTLGVILGMKLMADVWVPLYHKMMFRAWRAEDELRDKAQTR
jgi:hypothetical protein